MLIPYIPEKPHFIAGSEHADTEGVDGRVPEALVEESAGGVEVGEILEVWGGAEEGEGGDFEVGEELAVIVLPGEGVEEPGEVGEGMYQVRVLVDEVEGSAPERGEGAGVFEEGDVEAVD